MEFLPFPPQDLYQDKKCLFDDDMARISFGFRLTWFHPSSPRRASYDLLCVSAIGLPDEPRIAPRAFYVSREILERDGTAGAVRAIMGEVRAYEDEICLAELSGLPRYRYDLEYARNITVAGLLKFLGRMNQNRPQDMQLDTIFLSLNNFLRLASCHGERYGIQTPHANVLQVAGCTVIASDDIADDAAYFTSFKHGPRLVRGPTVIRCEKDRLDIEHYCDAIPAQKGSTPDIPAGFAVRLVPVQAKGVSQAGDIPVRAEPLDRFLSMARTLHNMKEHAMALTILARAPRSGRAGVWTCVLWEKVLGNLGIGDEDLVASHNDLLVCLNRLIESGFAGDELREARARVMRRLGLA